jgi:hypothetical protein
MRRRESVTFRSAASGGVVIGFSLLLVPIPVLGVAVAVSRGFDTTSLAVCGVLSVGVAIGVIAASRAAAFVRCDPDRVIVGLSPVWWSRLRNSDIAEVTMVTIDSYADYGGWGIKGRVRSGRGRLYSVGGSRSVRFRTLDGRVYNVAFADDSDAERASESATRYCRGAD